MDPKVMKSVWEKQKETANKQNDPGEFTTLVAEADVLTPAIPEQSLAGSIALSADSSPDPATGPRLVIGNA